MATLTYGLSVPRQLLEKLERDSKRVGKGTANNVDDVFNFVVTAAVLSEWITQAYKGHPMADGLSEAVHTKNKKRVKNIWDSLPKETDSWIADRSEVPIIGDDIRFHIRNILKLVWNTANASKHFHWTHEREVSDIQSEPIVKNWAQYFSTPTYPDIYVEVGDYAYSLTQVRSLLTQFFRGLLVAINEPSGALASHQ